VFITVLFEIYVFIETIPLSDVDTLQKETRSSKQAKEMGAFLDPNPRKNLDHFAPRKTGK